jgi:hypothetical protein
MSKDLGVDSHTMSICRRGAQRYHLLYANEAFLEFVGPDGTPWRCDLLGISADGLSFGLPDSQPMPERGVSIDHIAVRIAGVRIEGGLTIAHTTEEFAAGTICGARFHPASEADAGKLRKAIAALGW